MLACSLYQIPQDRDGIRVDCNYPRDWVSEVVKHLGELRERHDDHNVLQYMTRNLQSRMAGITASAGDSVLLLPSLVEASEILWGYLLPSLPSPTALFLTEASAAASYYSLVNPLEEPTNMDARHELHNMVSELRAATHKDAAMLHSDDCSSAPTRSAGCQVHKHSVELPEGCYRCVCGAIHFGTTMVDNADGAEEFSYGGSTMLVRGYRGTVLLCNACSESLLDGAVQQKYTIQDHGCQLCPSTSTELREFTPR